MGSRCGSDGMGRYNTHGIEGFKWLKLLKIQGLGGLGDGFFSVV